MLPSGCHEAEITVGKKKFRVTELNQPGKRRLLRYFIEIAPAILPHVKHRPILMNLPAARAPWIRTCGECPIVQDLGCLLWLVNAGGAALPAWPARCDDAHRPDYLQFDIGAAPGAGFGRVLDSALRLRDALEAIGMPAYAKTSGSRGIHVYAPIKRGPAQRDVWAIARNIAARARGEARIAWDRTLTSVYAAPGEPPACVSAPVTWEEIARGFRPEDFRIDNLPARVREIGDLWKPLTLARGRADLDRLVRRAAA